MRTSDYCSTIWVLVLWFMWFTYCSRLALHMVQLRVLHMVQLRLTRTADKQWSHTGANEIPPCMGYVAQHHWMSMFVAGIVLCTGNGPNIVRMYVSGVFHVPVFMQLHMQCWIQAVTSAEWVVQKTALCAKDALLHLLHLANIQICILSLEGEYMQELNIFKDYVHINDYNQCEQTTSEIIRHTWSGTLCGLQCRTFEPVQGSFICLEYPSLENSTLRDLFLNKNLYFQKPETGGVASPVLDRKAR